MNRYIKQELHIIHNEDLMHTVSSHEMQQIVYRKLCKDDVVYPLITAELEIGIILYCECTTVHIDTESSWCCTELRTQNSEVYST